MKTTTPKTARPSQATMRSFIWGIQSTDISFMRLGEAEVAMEGSPGGSDCSKIARFDKPRKKNPAPASGQPEPQ